MATAASRERDHVSGRAVNADNRDYGTLDDEFCTLCPRPRSMKPLRHKTPWKACPELGEAGPPAEGGGAG